MKSIAITITGRVQGVGFRYQARKVAIENDIIGFVKNMEDGSVYIEACGSDSALDIFVAWCYKGTPWAFVENIIIRNIQNTEYKSFSIQKF